LDFDPELSVQDTQQERNQTTQSGVYNNTARQTTSTWKSPYTAKPAQEVTRTTDSPRFGSTIQRHSLPEAQHQPTVTPLDVFPRSQSFERAIPLNSVLSTPVDSPIPSSFHVVESPSQGNVAKENDISVSDAAIKEIVKIVLLAVTKSKDTSNDRAARQGGERNGLPNGRISAQTASSDAAKSVAQVPSIVTQAGKNGEVSPTSGPVLDGPQAEDALRKGVLKVLNDLGCTPQKDPATSPKPLNAGSAASHKSENKVTCETCKKFQGRPCELK
jgi:hypothetical protein